MLLRSAERQAPLRKSHLSIALNLVLGSIVAVGAATPWTIGQLLRPTTAGPERKHKESSEQEPRFLTDIADGDLLDVPILIPRQNAPSLIARFEQGKASLRIRIGNRTFVLDEQITIGYGTIDPATLAHGVEKNGCAITFTTSSTAFKGSSFSIPYSAVESAMQNMGCSRHRRIPIPYILRREKSAQVIPCCEEGLLIVDFRPEEEEAQIARR